MRAMAAWCIAHSSSISLRTSGSMLPKHNARTHHLYLLAALGPGIQVGLLGALECARLGARVLHHLPGGIHQLPRAFDPAVELVLLCTCARTVAIKGLTPRLAVRSPPFLAIHAPQCTVAIRG